MIIARLRGGLGNQLFQYAAAKALAEHCNTVLKLDLYTYDQHPYRKFELHNFQVPVTVAARDEVHRFTGSNKLIRYLNKRENYFRSPRVFAQPHYHFYEDFLSLPSELYLSGYWQSEKYFSSIADKVRHWYQPTDQPDQNNLEMLARIKTANSVAVHVRKGDYGAEQYARFYGGLTNEYYNNAVLQIQKQTAEPLFFVFSDSIEWCKKNLTIEPAVFIDINPGANAYKDLVLMASCRHNVIANSTFSWWGAWLNANPGKIVIAPRKWFQKTYSEKKEPVYPCRYYNTKDLIPDQWTTI